MSLRRMVYPILRILPGSKMQGSPGNIAIATRGVEWQLEKDK